MISKKRGYKRDELKALRKRFERWRADRRGGEPIPGELWKAAVELIGPMSCAGVARELGLDAGKLRRKSRGRSVAPHPARRARAKSKAAVFVELSAPLAVPRGRAESENSAPSASVEFERADGTRLRLSGDAVRGLDLVALVDRFSATGARE